MEYIQTRKVNSIMSQESMWWLNNMTLIGNTKERGNAWHKDESYQGDEPNHYEDMIPFGDVKRRLFNWKPVVVQSAGLVPIEMVPVLDSDGESLIDDRTGLIVTRDNTDFGVPIFDANGNPIRSMPKNGKPGMALKILPTKERILVIRSDNGLDLGAFKTSYQPHDYNEWLLELTSNIIQDSLGILSAGLLRNGAQAWVEVSFPKAIHDDKTGITFMPYILCVTSLDGSLATSYSANDLVTQCDNTMKYNLSRAAANDRQAKLRHTLHSVSKSKMDFIRNKLNILELQAEMTLENLHTLGEINVTNQQWAKIVDELMELPEDSKSRGWSRINNRREMLNHVYHNDPMVNFLDHTALRVMQAVNTYGHHYSEIRGDAARIQRNMTRTVKDGAGSFAEMDLNTMKAIAKVLEKPELVSAN